MPIDSAVASADVIAAATPNTEIATLLPVALEIESAKTSPSLITESLPAPSAIPCESAAELVPPSQAVSPATATPAAVNETAAEAVIADDKELRSPELTIVSSKAPAPASSAVESATTVEVAIAPATPA